MNAVVKLGLYVAALAVLLVAGIGVGKLIGPGAGSATERPRAGHEMSTTKPGDSGESNDMDEMADDEGGHGTEHEAATELEVPGGLQVAQGGYRLEPRTTTVQPGRQVPFRFTITGTDGKPLTRFALAHEKRLHLIVVRRDLSGFQHLHPTMAANGEWSVPLTLAEPGAYRVYADFQPAGAEDGLTLGTDVFAPGSFQPKPLPAEQHTTTVDGYVVTIQGHLEPGKSSKLTLSVSKDGKPVTNLQPYLGAYGHLVALRDGDLAYLHVHPDGEPGDGKTKAGPGVTFFAEVPSSGAYRLYLDFQHEDTVRTAEFTGIAG
ncbi:hypothetical protein [Flindersiella endophytica]